MTLPILLVHGVCRFDELWREGLKLDNTEDPDLDNLHYFKGIRTMLLKNGFSVFHSNVPWAAPVEERADNLNRNITDLLAETGADKVNIIAHSMGGLDTRHMLYKDRENGRIHEKIASVTTISTPHAGSSFADWGVKNLGAVIPLAAKMKIDIRAFYDLTTEACRRFNETPEVIEFEDMISKTIQISTHAGRQDYWGVVGVLKPSFQIIHKQEGDNDGLVSVQSAKWRNAFFQTIVDHTDHLNELGWWDFDQLAAFESPAALTKRIHKFYLNVARQLPLH
jgi:triacylglycerol lipase